MRNNRVMYVTQTAVMLAVLIAVQFVTRSMVFFVTGSLVNMILLVSVFMIGLGGGLTIAILSPFLAAFVGVGPAFIQIVPFVAVANAILVLVAWPARKRIMFNGPGDVLFTAVNLIIAGAAKMAFLWVALVLIALPFIPGVTKQQISVIGFTFSWPQLVDAIIGGALAMLIVPLLRRAMKLSKI